MSDHEDDQPTMPAVDRAAIQAAQSNAVKPPNHLDVSLNAKADEFKLWVQQWGNYELVSGLNKQTEPMKKATFLSVIGPDALKVYNTF